MEAVNTVIVGASHVPPQCKSLVPQACEEAFEELPSELQYTTGRSAISSVGSF